MRHEITGKDGGPVQHDHRHFDFSSFGDDEVAAIAAIAERYRKDSLS